jgi:hypothetical protein
MKTSGGVRKITSAKSDLLRTEKGLLGLYALSPNWTFRLSGHILKF